MDLEAVLRERYGIFHTDVEDTDSDEGDEGDGGGTDSRTWWVSVDDERCYVARWVADGSVGPLAAGVQAAAVAEAGGVVAGAAVEAVGGDRVLLVDGGSLVLVHHLDGVPVAADDQQVVGETLARVHGATVGHDLLLGRRWPWVDPGAAHLEPHPDLRAAVAEVTSALAALPTLVTGIVHGDPAPEAFLRLPGRQTALVGWTSAFAGPLLYDLAVVTSRAGGVDQARPVLTAYADAGGPATPDLPHLETMLRVHEVVRADHDARRPAPGVEAPA